MVSCHIVFCMVILAEIWFNFDVLSAEDSLELFHVSDGYKKAL